MPERHGQKRQIEPGREQEGEEGGPEDDLGDHQRGHDEPDAAGAPREEVARRRLPAEEPEHGRDGGRDSSDLQRIAQEVKSPAFSDMREYQSKVNPVIGKAR